MLVPLIFIKPENCFQWIRMELIIKLNNKIFYVLEVSRYAPENDIGRRMSYCRIKTFVYCNNLDNGKTELLYEYYSILIIRSIEEECIFLFYF